MELKYASNSDKLKDPANKNGQAPDILDILSKTGAKNVIDMSYSIILNFPGTFPTRFSDWELIDDVEKSNVKGSLKPREKIVSFEEMLTIIKRNGGGWF